MTPCHATRNSTTRSIAPYRATLPRRITARTAHTAGQHQRQQDEQQRVAAGDRPFTGQQRPGDEQCDRARQQPGPKHVGPVSGRGGGSVVLRAHRYASDVDSVPTRTVVSSTPTSISTQATSSTIITAPDAVDLVQQ